MTRRARLRQDETGTDPVTDIHFISVDLSATYIVMHSLAQMNIANPYDAPIATSETSYRPWFWRAAVSSVVFVAGMHFTNALVEVKFGDPNRSLSSALSMSIMLIPAIVAAVYYLTCGAILFADLWSQSIIKHLIAGVITSGLFLALWSLAGYSDLFHGFDILIPRPFNRLTAASITCVGAVTATVILWRCSNRVDRPN